MAISRFLSGILLVLVLSPAAHAQARSGDWVFEMDKVSLSAMTTNESGASFGKFCYPSQGKCYWGIASLTKCEKGSAYPVLVNASAGALPFTLTCIGQIGTSASWMYAIHGPDSMDKAVGEGEQIGFAMPLANGLFRIVRFSLDGANKALAGLAYAATERMEKSTKDMTF